LCRFKASSSGEHIYRTPIPSDVEEKGRRREREANGAARMGRESKRNFSSGEEGRKERKGAHRLHIGSKVVETSLSEDILGVRFGSRLSVEARVGGGGGWK